MKSCQWEERDRRDSLATNCRQQPEPLVKLGRRPSGFTFSPEAFAWVTDVNASDLAGNRNSSTFGAFGSS